MNLQIFKTFGLLLLLLAGSIGTAYSFPETIEGFEKEGISYDVSEDSYELSQSNLTGPQFNHTPRIEFNGVENYYFRSTQIARKANLYIFFSHSIDLGLDVAAIIFPFHSFL